MKRKALRKNPRKLIAKLRYVARSFDLVLISEPAIKAYCGLSQSCLYLVRANYRLIYGLAIPVVVLHKGSVSEIDSILNRYAKIRVFT
jgi:hypothetical protein